MSIFSKQVFRYTNKRINEDVMNSALGNPSLRRIVSQTFKQANTRIKQLETNNLQSPAYLALGKENPRFTLKGQKWGDIRSEYARAIAFMRQPTSTVRGARQYFSYLKTKYNLTDKEFDYVQRSLAGKLTSKRDRDYVELYLMQYKDYTGDLENEAVDVSSEIEIEARNTEQYIDSALDNIYIDDELSPEDIDDIEKIFKRFKL